MNKAAIIIAVMLVLCGGVLYWYVSHQSETPVPVVNTPSARTEITNAKSVNAQVYLTKEGFQPSSLLVNRGDTLYVYVTPLESGLVALALPRDRRPLTEKRVETFNFLVDRDLYLLCSEGCPPDTRLTITAVDE